ncbi:MAG: transporter substrate-binding domain-containing protein [Lachnospiraceae bacterium]
MKKLIYIGLIGGVLLTGLVGCTSTGAANSTEEDVLRVGMDLSFAPFSYLDDNGEVAGFEPQIAEAFGEYLGVEVEIVNTDFSMLIPALETGDVDILIADMSKTEERAEKADFSDAYRYTYTLALVNSDYAQEHGITDDMSEEEFFAIEDISFIGLTGTKGVYYPQNYGLTVTEVPEIGTGLMEVSNGSSDVLIASNEVHGFHAADPNNTIVYSGIQAQEGSCFVVKKGNTELLDDANEFIATMYEEGGLYDQMAEEWDPIIAEFLQSDALGLDYIVTAKE